MKRKFCLFQVLSSGNLRKSYLFTTVEKYCTDNTIAEDERITHMMIRNNLDQKEKKKGSIPNAIIIIINGSHYY